MEPARSIADVIHLLDHIVSHSKKNNSRIGYFATLYRKMTLAIQKEVENKSFDDHARMESLDTCFANRYLEAWDQYMNRKTCSRSWQKAFDSCKNNNLTVIQHLIVGINTHINLDLGIAAAETAPGEKIHDLKKDFDKINEIIASLTQSVQDSLARIWFPLKALARISNNREDAVINFSIGAARRASWANAMALSVVDGDAKENYIGIIDDSVVKLADRIILPGMALRFLLRPVRMMEPQRIPDIIDLLDAQ